MGEKKTSKWKKWAVAGLLAIVLLFTEGKLADILCAPADIQQITVRAGDLEQVSGYENQGSRYTPINGDPSVSMQSDINKRIDQVTVRLSEKLPQQTAVQVYYDAGDGFSEENSVLISVPAGRKEFDVVIPAGNYSHLRLDINGSFSLDRVELGKTGSQNRAFENTWFWECALFINVMFLFALNKIIDIFPVVSWREQMRQYRKLRLFLWALLLFAGLVTLNSLYLGQGSYYYQNNGEGNVLLKNIDNSGTQEKKGIGFELERPGDVQSMVLYFDDAAKKDLTVKYCQAGGSGEKPEKEETVTWKRGTNSIALTGLDQSCAAIKLSVSDDVHLSRVYYRVSTDNVLSMKAVLVVLWILLSYGLSWFLMSSVRLSNTVQCIWDRGSWLLQNRKNIGITAGKYAAGIAVSLAVVLAVYAVCGRFFHWHVTGKTAIFLAGIVLLIDMAVFFREHFSRKIEMVGFLCIMIVGSLFAFLAPPYLGISWDDETHYRNAVQLSHSLDRQISYSDEIILTEYTGNALTKEHYSQMSQKSYSTFLDQLESAGFYVEDTGMGFTASQLVYIPSALGILTARGLGLPFHMTVIFGKWFNVWLLALLSYFAMRRLRSGKLVVLLAALIPTNIFIAGNYTYDTWLTGWIILGISVFFAEWQTPGQKISRSSEWLIAGSLLIAVLAKQTYFIITLATLFLPDAKFESKREAWCYRGLILGAVLVPFALLYFGSMGGGDVAALSDSRGGEGVSSAGQIDFMLHNPAEAAGILLRYLTGYLNPLKESGEYMNNMAYFGYIDAPGNFVLSVVVFGALFSREEQEPAKFPWWFKGGFLLEYIGVGAMSAVAMYVVYTAVGAETVMGCQGRYLLPIIFPTLYVLTRFSGKTYVRNALREENLNLLLLAVLIFFSLKGLWIGCLALY